MLRRTSISLDYLFWVRIRYLLAFSSVRCCDQNPEDGMVISVESEPLLFEIEHSIMVRNGFELDLGRELSLSPQEWNGKECYRIGIEFDSAVLGAVWGAYLLCDTVFGTVQGAFGINTREFTELVGFSEVFQRIFCFLKLRN
ncbi:hypothetical protein P5V15_001091 [Pogonomyrmex californicus]